MNSLSKIEVNDANIVFNYLLKKKVFPEKSRWLITGAGGFLGSQILNVLSRAREKGYDCEVVAVDSTIRGNKRDWYFTSALSVEHDVTQPFPDLGEFTHILHLASIASPKFYRKYPLETLNANYLGTVNILDIAKKSGSKVLLVSSSEVYGDPAAGDIPTKESYRGNVSSIGPRACYDEGKRVMETLGWIYNEEYGLNIKIARPFNFYGPGMRLDDGRVLPDFINSIISKENLVIHSDGLPTRSFCYVSDALRALLQITLDSPPWGIFNVGNDETETSVLELAQMCSELGNEFGWKGKILQKKSEDLQYLVNNPQRRMPDITKIKENLHWTPEISLENGIRRSLEHFSGTVK